MESIDKRNPSNSGENPDNTGPRFRKKQNSMENGDKPQEQRPFRNYRGRRHEQEYHDNRSYNGPGYGGGNLDDRRDNRDNRQRQPRNNYVSGHKYDYKNNQEKSDRNYKNNILPQNQNGGEDVYVNEENNKNTEVISLGTNTREFIELPESINDFENMTFLSENLFRGIHDYGFKFPSLIQSRTMHIINSGCDLIAQSQSGSGKTGAFAIGALSRIDKETAYPQAVIIANTRLLALQIHKVVENIAKFMGIEVVVCVGGSKTNSQMSFQQVKNAHFLVGTPGRISEMLTKKNF